MRKSAWLTMTELRKVAVEFECSAESLRDKITDGYARGGYVMNVARKIDASREHQVAERIIRLLSGEEESAI